MNQRKGENDRRKYFMINLHERMLPTSAGVEPATSWSPVVRRIQLSHRGRPRLVIGEIGDLCRATDSNNLLKCTETLLLPFGKQFYIISIRGPIKLSPASIFRSTCQQTNFIDIVEKYWFTLSILSKIFSRRHIELLSYFSQKTGFDISCRVFQRRQFAWNVTKILFSREATWWILNPTRGNLVSFSPFQETQLIFHHYKRDSGFSTITRDNVVDIPHLYNRGN